MKNTVLICKRCIIDSTVPGVEFDSDGICNHCENYDELERHFSTDRGSQNRLNKIVAEIKRYGKNRDYDCVLGISGGTDSTYMLYMAKKLGLRPLAVHLDNEWNSKTAINNMKKTVEKLNVDLRIIKVDWEEFRDLQISFLKASVSDAEIPTDIAIKAVLYKTATEEGLKYVIYGGSNFRTEGTMPREWTYMDGRYIISVQKMFGTKELKTFPNLTISDIIYYKYVKRIRLVRLLNFIDFRHNDVVKLLERKLGWKYYGGKHYESVYTRFIQSYILPRKFNIDKRIVHYSAMIRSGQLTREQALEKMKEPPYPEDRLREDKEYILGKLEMSEEEFDRILVLPPRSFRDYPTYFPFTKRMQFAKRLGIWPQVG